MINRAKMPPHGEEAEAIEALAGIMSKASDALAPIEDEMINMHWTAEFRSFMWLAIAAEATRLTNEALEEMQSPICFACNMTRRAEQTVKKN
jgi:hypothetical protein